ncbi:hypothetical protein ALC62_15064 [Cyphomyrmex costatus]|uniref:Uncharacterized protein n=1 Tax=Cyphomyrmex costatus TaxID=456900 RepID=A0A151I819_9HYME|nr:hypothetical protein ALC62_15064 [Cyphomyrmex costatus]
MLPKRPPNAAMIMMGHCGAANCSTAVSTDFLFEVNKNLSVYLKDSKTFEWCMRGRLIWMRGVGTQGYSGRRVSNTTAVPPAFPFPP